MVCDSAPHVICWKNKGNDSTKFMMVKEKHSFSAATSQAVYKSFELKQNHTIKNKNVEMSAIHEHTHPVQLDFLKIK